MTGVDQLRRAAHARPAGAGGRHRPGHRHLRALGDEDAPFERAKPSTPPPCDSECLRERVCGARWQAVCLERAAKPLAA
eukprot:3806014-Rhodomonas_salina.1